MSKKKASSRRVSSQASKVLRDPKASKIQKQLAGSALSQANVRKYTGSKMEEVASKVLQSNKYNRKTKSLAGSVLSQSKKER